MSGRCKQSQNRAKGNVEIEWVWMCFAKAEHLGALLAENEAERSHSETQLHVTWWESTNEIDVFGDMARIKYTCQ